MIMELKKKYYGITDDHRQVFIHRNCYDALVNHLANNGISKEYIEVTDIAVPAAKPALFRVKEKFTLHDYQEIIKEDILRPLVRSARVDLQTGKGKTLTSLASAADPGLSCRTLVMVPPKYFGIWEEALQDVYEDIYGRFMTCSGSAELQKLIDRGMNDDLDGIDVIIMSQVTYRGYIEAFERLGGNLHTVGYNVPPPRFHEVLKVGLQINDEIQEDPGLVFRIDIYTNVAKQIYLSATPYTGNAYVTKMIEVMLPPITACRLPNYDVYIDVMALMYSDPTVTPKDYLTPYKNTYNHMRYETEMMKNKKRLAIYNTMVLRILNGIFVNDMLPEQKCLTLCATVVFIQQLVKYLKEHLPDLVINEHVSGCPYERLLTNNITVSTMKSSGTGVDIPNLRECLLLHSTDSKKDNIQIAGRLRKLKLYPDITPRFTYTYCINIPQQVKYHHRKSEHFEGKCNKTVVRRVS
jgi:superfamily II DNA or RNA helicase